MPYIRDPFTSGMFRKTYVVGDVAVKIAFNNAGKRMNRNEFRRFIQMRKERENLARPIWISATGRVLIQERLTPVVDVTGYWHAAEALARELRKRHGTIVEKNARAFGVTPDKKLKAFDFGDYHKDLGPFSIKQKPVRAWPASKAYDEERDVIVEFKYV